MKLRSVEISEKCFIKYEFERPTNQPKVSCGEGWIVKMNLDVYEMQVMTFGATCSPKTAQYVKNKNAEEFRGDYPEAYTAITEKHYVDDYLDSASTEAIATQRIRDVIEVHKQGGFEIRTRASNSSNVLSSIPKELRAVTDNQLIGCGDLPVERVLGIRWDINSDVFCFTVRKQTEGRKYTSPTKRDVLKLVMSVFDPLGFISNYTIQAKMLMQDIWRSGVGWDDELADEYSQKWSAWTSQIPALEAITIPRPYSKQMRERVNLQLHVFCDASEQAYASVAYLRVQTNNSVGISFVMGKARVAPLKPTSIPRLELMAAVIGTRMAACIRKEHEVTKDEVVYWTDSRKVLCWIRSDALNYKQFVSHRVGEILETTEVENWRWVPTADNAADDSTRDNKPAELHSNSRWLCGPTFLNCEKWPQERQ